MSDKKRTVYRATYSDGKYILGSEREVAGTLFLASNYIRQLARSGKTTARGIRITVEEPGSMSGKFNVQKYYVATNPDEDPIIGYASEISALTGLSSSWIRTIARNGKTCRGWSVREATEEERRDFDETYGNP